MAAIEQGFQVLKTNSSTSLKSLSLSTNIGASPPEALSQAVEYISPSPLRNSPAEKKGKKPLYDEDEEEEYYEEENDEVHGEKDKKVLKPGVSVDINCPVCFCKWSDGNQFYVASVCGHSICGVCTTKVKQCPICRKDVSNGTSTSNILTSSTINQNVYVPNYILNDWVEYEPVRTTPSLSDVYASAARETVDAVVMMVRKEIDAMMSGERPKTLKDQIEFTFEKDALPGSGEIGELAMETICTTIQNEVLPHFGESFVVRVSGVPSSTRVVYSAIKVRAQLKKGFMAPAPNRTRFATRLPKSK